MPSQLRSLLDKRVGAAATFRLLLAEQRQTAQGPDFFHFTRVMERRPRCSVRSAVLGLNTSLSGNSIGHWRHCRHEWQSQGKRHWGLSGIPDFRWRDWPTCAHSSTRSWRPARGSPTFKRAGDEERTTQTGDLFEEIRVVELRPRAAEQADATAFGRYWQKPPDWSHGRPCRTISAA